MTTPAPVDVTLAPRKMTAASRIWQACWGLDWDGDAFYSNLDDAMHGAALDYRDAEYGYPDPTDDEDMPKPSLQWRWQQSRWALYDGGEVTGVELVEADVLAEDLDAQ